MLRWFTQPWPWYVTGPLIGVLVPVLLLIGNKTLGVSSSLRAMCAALIPGNVEFFNYDWRTSGLWNVALAMGIIAGAALTAAVVGVSTPAITPATRDAIATLGVHHVAGLVPAEIFSWKALLTVRGAACIVGGGFLVGFGASYLKAVFFADNLVLNAFFFFLGKWVFDILYFIGEQRVHGFELLQQLMLWSPLSAAVTAAVGVLLLFIMRPLLEPTPS